MVGQGGRREGDTTSATVFQAELELYPLLVHFRATSVVGLRIQNNVVGDYNDDGYV